MANPLEISAETLKRLQKHATPFVDTVDSVVNRILDEYEKVTDRIIHINQELTVSTRSFDPEVPPNLTHTKLLRAELNGVTLLSSETTWNSLLHEAVRIAARQSKSYSDFAPLMLVNHVVGKKEVDGYKFLEDVGISVQGQDANSAWRAVFHIAKLRNLSFHIVFVWRQKLEAQFPGVTGKFYRDVGGSS